MNTSHFRVLPKSLHEVGKALLNHKDLVSAVFNSKDLYADIASGIMADIVKERVHLCEKKRFTSILRQTNPNYLKEFQWSKLLDEWKKEAPLFHRFLTTVATPSSTSLSLDHFPAVCASGAILLRSRNIHMSAVHYLIGLVLFHGNLSKTVSYMQITCLYVCISCTPFIWSSNRFVVLYNSLSSSMITHTHPVAGHFLFVTYSIGSHNYT